jgi:hypothetical protein
MTASARAAESASVRPALVSLMPRPCGTTSGVPTASDSAASRLLTVGCGTPSSSAALVTCSVSLIAASNSRLGANSCITV